MHTTIGTKLIALLYKDGNCLKQIAKGRGCRLARLGTGETQFIHLNNILPQQSEARKPTDNCLTAKSDGPCKGCMSSGTNAGYLPWLGISERLLVSSLI